jgi:hypothetical protein
MIAKIGKKTPTFENNEPPSNWRKTTLKAWALFFLYVFVLSLLFGILVGLAQRALHP